MAHMVLSLNADSVKSEMLKDLRGWGMGRGTAVPNRLVEVQKFD